MPGPYQIGSSFPGRFLCTPTQYAPGSRASSVTSSTTMAAVSSANINTGSFTAPASGSVLVTASLVAVIATGGDHMAFGLAAHGTTTPMVSSEWIFATTGASPLPYIMPFLVTSLTPGTSYNFDLMFASTEGVALTVFSQGVASTTPSNTSGAPTIMTVQAV